MDFLTVLIPTVVVVGVGVFFAFKSGRAALAIRAAASGQGPQATALADAYRRFFEATGYCYVELADTPIDAQVADAMRRMQEATRDPYKKTHMVRQIHDFTIHWEQQTTAGRAGGWSTSCDFTIPLSAKPRVLWHVAERSFGSTGEKLKGMVTNLEHNYFRRDGVKAGGLNARRKWGAPVYRGRPHPLKPAFATRIETGDAAFDKRFQVFGEDAAAVLGILGYAPIRAGLLSYTEVDLRVLSDRVWFADPLMNNLRAAYGGNAGMMAAANNPGRLLELSTPFHNHVADLLVAVARWSA
ncbi:MAG: hypothetical protein HYY84_08620 [Deltaproteobacteria bacterium]|nr:hypothetical protein [Deltaproteobacteria bacterium]